MRTGPGFGAVSGTTGMDLSWFPDSRPDGLTPPITQRLRNQKIAHRRTPHAAAYRGIVKDRKPVAAADRFADCRFYKGQTLPDFARIPVVC